jgi:MFS family permease
MGAHDDVPGQEPLSDRPAAGLAIVGLGASLAPLDIAVNIALPVITAHFGLALGDVQWVVICYVLVYGSLMLVCGKLGDLFGHRLIFCLGLALSVIGLTACALAPDWSLFLWARAGQGIGTALALSCAPALATSLYPESGRTKALAGFAASQALAAAIGPLLGGALIQIWDWSAVYWMRVPVALAALALSGLLPSPKAHASTMGSRRFDGVGAVLLAGWMSALLLSLVFAQRGGVPLWLPLLLLALAAAGFAAFLRREAHFPEPIIRPALFADPAFAVPNVMNMLANLAGFAILLLTPYYLLNTLGLSVLAGGLVLALELVGGIGGASLAARVIPLFGQRRVAFTGIVIEAVALLGLGQSTADTAIALIVAVLAVMGIGQGLLNVAYTDIVTGTLARRDRGVAGSLALLTRTLGIVGGASVLSALHAHGAAGLAGPEGFLAGYRFAFTAAGGGLLVALAISCLWRRAWFTAA